MLCKALLNSNAPSEMDWGLWGTSSGWSIVWTSLAALVIQLFLAIRGARLFNNHAFADKNTYITALVLPTMLALLPNFYYLDSVSISLVFLLLILFQLFHLQQNTDGRKVIFNSGIFLGIAITFSPPMAFALPFVYLMVLVIRPFILREFVLLITGTILPLIYLGLFVWYKDIPIDLDYQAPEETLESFPLEGLAILTSFALMFLFAVLAVSSGALKSSIRSKRLTRMLLWLSAPLAGIALYHFLFYGEVKYLSWFALPLSLLGTLAIINKRYRGLMSVMLYLLLAFVLLKLFL